MILTAEQAKQLGMARALVGAGREFRGAEILDRFLRHFPRGDVFQSYDVICFAREQGCVTRDDRAWGPILTEAYREGRILPAGFAVSTNPKAHKRPVRLWRRV